MLRLVIGEDVSFFLLLKRCWGYDGFIVVIVDVIIDIILFSILKMMMVNIVYV
jgi:hypothetical protein